MPKIIVISRYIKPTAHKRFGNYIKYIATREGVEKPTQNQESSRELDREIFMNYLNSRPNSHGLFSETDDPIVLDRAAKEVANHTGAIWTHIVSLRRDDAERMGYNNLKMWKDLVRRHIKDIAEAQKIAPENIRWYAAFHNKETNPHVHIVVYSADPRKGYLNRSGIEKIRSAFANDIYHDELQNLYQQQTIVRGGLRAEAKRLMDSLLKQLQNAPSSDSRLEMLIRKLSVQLQNSKGKKVYGYMQPEVKKTVDEIVAELAKNPILQKMYDQWCKLEQIKYETYTSVVQKFPPLEENKAFKPIKNAVIRAVLDLKLPDAAPDLELPEDEKKQNNNNNIQGAAFDLLKIFGRIISDDFNRNYRGQMMRTEHKLKNAIRRKKLALGIKESPLETYQFREV